MMNLKYFGNSFMSLYFFLTLLIPPHRHQKQETAVDSVAIYISS